MDMNTIDNRQGKIAGIAVAILGFLFITTVSSAQDWYNPSWQYRAPVTVTNPGTTAITDIQVNIKLRTDNFDFTKANSDGSDVILTGSDGTSPLAFWVENWVSGDTASIWVKVPSLPAQGTTMYLYYGNAGATSGSNGQNTFVFFDDFESGWSVTPHPSVWVDKAIIPTPSADATASVYNNRLYTFGGYGIDHVTLNTTYEYDPATDIWTYKALMPSSRWGMVSVEFDSKIYVFGGQDRYANGVNQNEIYDPATDTWTSRALGNPLPIQNYGAEEVVHPDVIYFPGGYDGYEYWMAYTPYPPTSLENPCIVRSHDGIRWTDAGITNPVIPKGDPGAWNDQENPDPDFIYVSDLNKWFMIWDGGDVATDSRKLALAYSSDGITWTQYDGVSINGNTNPVILSGDDNNGQAWERDGFGHSQTCTPSLFYEDGTFYLYYAEEASGNNRGQIGLATFTWNNTTDDVVNLQRNSGNPIITLPEDAIFKYGAGHLDVSKLTSTNTYQMYLVRELLGAGVNYELSLLTSSSLTGGWASQGKVIERGASGEWDDNHIYRSCPLVNSAGEIVVNGADNTIRIFYSAFDVNSYAGIGIADVSLTDGSVVKFAGTGPQPMPAEISYQGLMGVSDGSKIHLFYKAYHYEYDPVTDTYLRILPDVPNPRTWATCAYVGGNIYLIGGYTDVIGSEGGTTDNQMWNMTTNSWETKEPCPRSRYGSTRENPVINGKIYATHGWNNYWFYTATYVYDPLNDTWEKKGSANHARDGVACGVINDKLYVVGGRNVPSPGTFGIIWNEEYDPAIDTWVPTDPPSTWNTSGADNVYTSAAASYQGNSGLVIRDPMDGSPSGLYSAETTQEFGTVYAVDYDWNVTTLGGISEAPTTYPETAVRMNTEIVDYGSLVFYQNTVPTLEWLRYPNLTFLQSGTWNDWHKVTIVRDVDDCMVTFDGNLYAPLLMTPSGGDPNGPGKVRFGSIRTTQYVDNVRIRKWVGADPLTIVGIEQSGLANHWIGSVSSDWNTTGNWSSGVVPDPGDDIAIFDGTFYPILTGSVACQSLTIEPLASLTITNTGTLTTGAVTINSAGILNSGSLIVNGTLTTGSGAVPITYNRYTTNDSRWHYLSSPVSSATLPSGTFYRYDEIIGDWVETSVCNSGIGYTLRTSGTNVPFTGNVVTSDVLVPLTSPYRYDDFITGLEVDYSGRTFVQSSDGSHSGAVTRSLTNYGGGGWNLLGNPYTSSLSVSSLIGANYSETPSNSQLDPNYVALYLYNGSTYYYVSNSTGWPAGEELNQDYIQTGQGFFVLAMNDNATFTFSRSMQAHSNEDLLLKSAPVVSRWPGLQLKAKAGNDENITTIVFGDEMKLGLDPGYDVGLMQSGAGPGIYTALVEDNGINFTRQALPVNGSVKTVIPVGIDYLKGGPLTLSAEIEPLRNYRFLLEDRLTGVITDLGTNTYTVTLPANTLGTGRFFVHVAAGRSFRPELKTEDSLLEIRIWASQDNQINIQGAVSDKASVEIFDIWGHKVYETLLSDEDLNTITLPSVRKGVYIVKVTDGVKIVSGKVALF
jgi:N-acetylneuraminic acid mutarotase